MEKVLTTNASPLPLTKGKPFIKDFFNADREIDKYLNIRLPHVPYSIMKLCIVSVSKDKKTRKYRVNWYRSDSSGFVTTSNLVSSQYVQVNTTKDGHVESHQII